MRERRQGSLLDALKRWESFVNIEPQLDWISPSSGAGAHLAFPPARGGPRPKDGMRGGEHAGQRLGEAGRCVQPGREAGRCASLGEAVCWPGGRCVVRGWRPRAQAFALSEAAASVIRNGRLTMAYRSRKSFFDI